MGTWKGEVGVRSTAVLRYKTRETSPPCLLYLSSPLSEPYGTCLLSYPFTHTYRIVGNVLHPSLVLGLRIFNYLPQHSSPCTGHMNTRHIRSVSLTSVPSVIAIRSLSVPPALILNKLALIHIYAVRTLYAPSHTPRDYYIVVPFYLSLPLSYADEVRVVHTGEGVTVAVQDVP